MIMSGWILQDMYEIKCLSCSHKKEHLKVVEAYLSNLKEKDYNSYLEILHEYFKLKSRRKVLDLEDFAVIKLGWIKIINSPIKVVFYSPESPMDLLVKRYMAIGFSSIAMDEKQSIINIHIPSQELI